MGGQSGGAQTVTNRTEVDPVTQAWRQQIINAGGQLYNQGVPAYYPNSTVVPFSNQTQSGLNYLQNQAMQGAPNLQAANNASGRALSGWNPAMPFAANVASGGLSNNPAMQGLSQYGTGNNQYAQSLFNQAAGDVGNAVNAQFAQSGRFGNNAARTDTMTRGIGNLYNQMMTPLYETERNRGLQAQTAMGSLYDTGANRALGGAELLGGLYSQGNQDAARAQALLPGLFQYGQMPGQAMLDVGGMYEGQADRYLADDMARYNHNSTGGWDLLNRYSQTVSGMPDFSGSTSTQRGPGTNRLMSGLGGAATGAGIASALPSAFMASNPLMWPLLIGGGAAGGLFSSDRRLKREAKPIGTDAKGQRWWSFRYLWDKPGTKRIGVMADEAERVTPHAVVTMPSGFKAVQYGAI